MALSKFFTTFLAVAILTGCGNPRSQLTAVEQIPQSAIDEEITAIKKSNYQIICHSSPRVVQGKSQVGILALRLDRKGKDDAQKIEDHDGRMVWYELEKGKLTGSVGTAFNVRFSQDRVVPAKEQRLDVSLFVLHGGGAATNYQLLVLNSVRESSGWTVKGRLYMPAQEGHHAEGELLHCPVANLK